MGMSDLELWPLPMGWKWRRLGEVVTLTQQKRPDQMPDQPFTYVDIASVDNVSGVISSPKTLLGRDAPSRARKIICAHDVIFATTRPYLRNIALVPEMYDGQICSTGFCVLRARLEMVEPTWLYHVCRSDVVLSQIEPLMRGATYPAVSDNDVLATFVPVPPLPEQRRIVARIEAVFARLTEARRLHESISQDVNVMVESAVNEVFEGECNWPHFRLGDIINIEAKQVDPTQPEYSDLPHVGGSVIESITGRLQETHSAQEDGMISSKYLFAPGDVLYSKIRPYLRKATLVEFMGLCSADIYPLKVNSEYLTPEFLKWMLVAPTFTKYAVTLSGRARMPKLNREQLFAYDAAIPDMAEQRRIVAYLDGVQAQVAALRAAQAVAAAELTQLEESILVRAFRGEL